MRNLKNLMKKIVASTLCACMLVSTAGMGTATAVEENPDNFNLDGTLPVVVDADKMEPIKIAYVQPADATVPVAEKAMTKEIFGATNIPVEWVEIPAAESAEKINLMLASGDYPDVFWNGISSTMIAQYTNSGIFIPTEDLIKEYAPTLAEILETHPEYDKLSYAPDGHKYGFPFIGETQGLVTFPGPFLINKNWLDQVGKEVPTTVDEFADCLRAFKEAGDLNGNGIDDEVPFSMEFGNFSLIDSYDPFWYFTGAFGEMIPVGDKNPTANFLRLIDDKIVFAANNDSFRKTCDFFHQLYEEGLLDPDAFAPSGTGTPLYINKLAQSEAVIGACSLWAYDDNFLDKSVSEQYVGIPRLTGPEGKCGTAPSTSEMQETSMVAITDKCKYPEVITSLVEYCLDPKIAMTLNYGPIGVMFVEDENGRLHANLDENGKIKLYNGWQYYSEQRNNSTPARGCVVLLNEYCDEETGCLDIPWDCWNILKYQKENGKFEVLDEYKCVPKMILSVEESNGVSQVQTAIETLVKEYEINGIMYGTDDAGWEQYKKDLEDAGISELERLYQQAYDRYLAS